MVKVTCVYLETFILQKDHNCKYLETCFHQVCLGCYWFLLFSLPLLCYLWYQGMIRESCGC